MTTDERVRAAAERLQDYLDGKAYLTDVAGVIAAWPPFRQAIEALERATRAYDMHDIAHQARAALDALTGKETT